MDGTRVFGERVIAADRSRRAGDPRHLQDRWDSVINAGVALQTLTLAPLCVALAAV